MPAQLIACSVPSADAEAGQEFYSALMGTHFAHTPIEHPTYHAWVAAGVKLNVERPYNQSQRIVCQFLVDDLDAAIRVCEGKGGKLVANPFELTMDNKAVELLLAHYESVWGRKPEGVGTTLGRCAIVMDPNQNQVGLVQLESWAALEYAAGSLTDFHAKEQESSVRLGRNYHG